jgi:hypothetical protein
MFITPERLGVPRSAGVVDLTLPNHVEHETINLSLSGDSFNVDEHETINLSSNSFNIDDYQDEADADVLEWISANIGKKVSYEATRRFQGTWVVKLTWAECVKGCDGFYDFVKCIVCRYM